MGEVVYVLLWKFLKVDLTKFIESQVKNINWYMICLLIEKGICLTGNVCIWSKLIILLNHNKAGKFINCIFFCYFHSQQVNIQGNYVIYFCYLYSRFSQVLYFILGCKLILITWTFTWTITCRSLLFLTLECSVTNVIKWTWSKYLHLQRSKTQRFCLCWLFPLYMRCILEKYICNNFC